MEQPDTRKKKLLNAKEKGKARLMKAEHQKKNSFHST